MPDQCCRCQQHQADIHAHTSGSGLQAHAQQQACSLQSSSAVMTAQIVRPAMSCQRALLACPKLALSLAQMMSHIIASSHPPPRAKPFTAATMGILTCRDQPAAGGTMIVSQVQQQLDTGPHLLQSTPALEHSFFEGLHRPLDL